VTEWGSLALGVALALALSSSSFLLGRRSGRRAHSVLGGPAQPNFHSDIAQRILESLPGAIVVYRNDGKIVAYNELGRRLFLPGSKGTSVLSSLTEGGAALQSALAAEGDAILTLNHDDVQDIFYVTKRSVAYAQSKAGEDCLNIVSAQSVADALQRHEVEAWKRLVRTLSHEINNSLAPILSLMSSATRISQGSVQQEKLHEIFRAVGERGTHLREFLTRYASLARIPDPVKGPVVLENLFSRMRVLYPKVDCQQPVSSEPVLVDESQLEQVLVNLIVNALEAGSPAESVVLRVQASDGVVRLSVSDGGPGFSNEALESAFVPSFSTKATGTGIGLAFCREVIHLHGGKIRVRNRKQGGGEVVILLGGPAGSPPPRFTITM
jgi:two-component system, NtrC family, nitrogen regulation sensor histidine kinase NtrY